MSSREASVDNFGLLMAYVLPGFTALQGLPYLSASPAAVLGPVVPGMEPTLAGFLYGTIQAITVGLTVSAVRWLVLDTLHHKAGLEPPQWDFALLTTNVAAFELLVNIHYRYYKFYANMVVALLCAYASRGYTEGWRGIFYWLLVALFFVASRDALRLCGRPHKRSYVIQSLMWPRGDSWSPGDVASLQTPWDCGTVRAFHERGVPG